MIGIQSDSIAQINEIYDSLATFSDKKYGLLDLSLVRLPPANVLKLEFDQDLLERIIEKTRNL